MPALAVPARFRGGSDLDLEDARESLAYWERRAQTLPRTAVRRRREARAMAARWHERVALAEREAYGRGLLGALLLVAAERRLPEAARHRSRVAVRRASQAMAMVVVALMALVLAGVVAAVEVLAAVLRAVG